MQDSRTLKSEIITALDRLSVDSLRLLAKFVSFLRTDAAHEEPQAAELASEVEHSCTACTHGKPSFSQSRAGGPICKRNCRDHPR